MGGSCGCGASKESSGSVLRTKDEIKIDFIAKQMADDCLKKFAVSNPDKLNFEESLKFLQEFLPLSSTDVKGEMTMKHFKIQKDAPEIAKLSRDLFNSFDKDKDGLLDKNEIYQGLFKILRDAKGVIDNRKEKEENLKIM